jgi:ubiquinone/menaquinone biosynthesis C-methylase UbiE
MTKTSDEIYRTRKEFFNDRAEGWQDMWYKDRTTGRYDKYARSFGRLFSIVPLKGGDHVLDAGCGTGVLVPFILELIGPGGMLYELDFAEKMIEVNQRLHRAENIRFITADAEEAPLGNASCDAVICFAAFPHFHDKEKATATLGRILKPGGTFVVAHFESSDGIARHHGSCKAVMHDRLPDAAAMGAMLGRAGLASRVFIDEPGFYCIAAEKTAPQELPCKRRRARSKIS